MHGTQLGAPIHGDGDLNKWGLGRRRIKFLEFENLSFAEKFQRRRRRVVDCGTFGGVCDFGPRVTGFQFFSCAFSLWFFTSHPL